MFDKAITIGILILVGLPITWVLRKVRVKITIPRIMFVWILGYLFAFNTVGKLGFYIGIMLMGIATALFFSHMFVTNPAKKRAAEFEEILFKAKSGLLNEDEACELLKKATAYEAKGLLSDAKHLYELIVKSDTSISADALSCLKNPLLKNVDTLSNSQ